VRERDGRDIERLRGRARNGGVDRAPGLVLYDEDCAVCTAWMRFVIARARRGELLFVPVRSWLGERLLASAGMTPADYDSMIYADGARQYLRSDAIVEVLTRLGGPWRIARALLLVPAGWRDFAYAALARNRYRWSGRRCCRACGRPR
jgi:predicted DCC family thiol-disulfide oxidoreductase YuxK